MILASLPQASAARPVLVVGAGPAGIVHALELRRHGIEVAMLAGGGDGFDPGFQALADAEIVDPRRHAPMQLAVRRALGGASLLWGGRCVPFDAADFAARPQVPDAAWPIGAEAIAPWYDRVAPYLDAGDPVFEAPLPGLDTAAECRLDRLERWSETRNLRMLHAAALASDDRLLVHLDAVAVDLAVDRESGRVAGVIVANAAGERRTVRARAVVLACGGLETTRLLLAARIGHPAMFGGEDGPLGRYYMGHLEGRIADIVFAPAVPEDAFDFHLDRCGRYVRRRINVSDDAQRRLGLLNMAAWPDNPALRDPAHRSAILSLAYLALATPGLGSFLAPDAIRRKHLEAGVNRFGGHLLNVLGGIPAAARESAKFLHGRYVARPRLPGFFIRNAARRYALFYHAEQAPNPASRVTLSDRCDALGMRRLRIDLRYGDIDARSVVAGHRVIDRHLQTHGLGRLEYAVPDSERHNSVLDQANDGYHQIGTTRMAAVPGRGVVDADCRVHGTPNLFVASSSVFPSSGQANPTLLIAALSARLAAHLARILAGLPETAPVETRRLKPGGSRAAGVPSSAKAGSV